MINDGGMVLLLLVLGAIMVYLLFSKGFWLDKYCRDERKSWGGEDVEPDYNTNQQSIHDAISQEKVPFTPSLEIPFEDPEVPNRPSKTKKKKTKRVYKKRSKKK
jgi:hypothetical protein